MLFTKLKLSYFGRFHNKELDLKPGINIIYGDNEAGKSTIHTFIKGMLFGIERLRGRGSSSKEDQYTRYLPWEYPGAFGGSMEIGIGEKRYRIQRSFHANDKQFVVIDLDTGREIVQKDGHISEIIPGLTESTFKNTVSIEQLKASTDGELVLQVRNYITNLSIAKSKEVDVQKAISMLNEQRKHLESGINPDLIANLEAEIAEGIAKEDRMDLLSSQLNDLTGEEKQIELDIDLERSRMEAPIAKHMEQLPAILEKYRYYQDLTQREEQLKIEYNNLLEKISIQERELEAESVPKEDISKLQELLLQSQSMEDAESEFGKDNNNLKQKGSRIRYAIVLPAVLIALIIAGINKLHPVGMVVAIVIVISSVIVSLILSGEQKEDQNDSDQRMALNRKNRERIRDELRQIMHRYGVNHPEQLFRIQEEVIRKSYLLENAKEQSKDMEMRLNDIEDDRDSIYDIIMKYMHLFIREDELTPRAMERLQELHRNMKHESNEKLLELNRRRDGCRVSIEKLRWEIDSLVGNEEKLLKDQERLKELKQKQEENLTELEAVKLALQAIQELAADIHDSFGHQLNRAVSDMISEVTGEKYTDLKVNEKLEIKVGWNQNYVPIDRLSAGTIDQVYFALRLAVSQLLLPQEDLPILLDDSFALYDNNRVKGVIKMLLQKQQVILFTCHNREQELMKEMGIPFHFIDLSNS